MISAQEIADQLAKRVWEEIESRGVKIWPAEVEKFCKTSNQNFFGVTMRDLYDESLFQVNLAIPFREDSRERGVEDFCEPLAKELSLKVIRPFSMKFFTLELPQRTYEAALGRYKDVLVRVVSDYYLPTDQIVTRFDVLVEWNDR